jgi:lipoate-protein ligase A
MIEQRVGAAGSLHASWPGAEAQPDRVRVAVCRVEAPAVVLGSTQPDRVVDGDRAAAAGIAVARRRSGGGAVLVTPDDPVWIDVWLPIGHPLWRSDVGQAFHWLGEAWVDALTRSGITGVTSRRQGYLSCTRWSSLVCFGGVGTGEVVAEDGRKVVGLAQRRNRTGAWFHGACVLTWDAEPLVDVLAMAPDERSAARGELEAAVVGTTELLRLAGRPALSGEAIAAAFADALP